MRISRGRWPMLAVFAIVSLCMLAGTSQADRFNKKTVLTFAESVQVPGMVLPAGTYVFKLEDSQGNRHVVQIWSEDGTKLITTVLTISNEQTEPAGKTVITYDERPTGEPIAVKEWFYPGDNRGHEFVYPKSRAAELSTVNHVDVPSTGTEEAYTPPPAPEAEEPAPQQPAAQEEAPAPAPAPTPAPQTEMQQPEAQPMKQLPQTASEEPEVLLAGMLCLGAFVVLRRVSQRRFFS